MYHQSSGISNWGIPATYTVYIYIQLSIQFAQVCSAAFCLRKEHDLSRPTDPLNHTGVYRSDSMIPPWSRYWTRPEEHINTGCIYVVTSGLEGWSWGMNDSECSVAAVTLSSKHTLPSVAVASSIKLHQLNVTQQLQVKASNRTKAFLCFGCNGWGHVSMDVSWVPWVVR